MLPKARCIYESTRNLRFRRPCAGKIKADAQVAQKLFDRATGSEWTEEQAFKIKVGRGEEQVKIVTVRRVVRCAMNLGVSIEDEIWYGALTFKQAKQLFWRRLKQAIPPEWRQGKPNETECSITLQTGHV